MRIADRWFRLPLFNAEGAAAGAAAGGGAAAGAEGGGSAAGAAAGGPGAATGAAAGAGDGKAPGAAAGGDGKGAQAPDIGTVLSSEEWIKHVPTEHLKAASKFKTFNDFAKGYADAESRLGKAVFLPEKDAKPEDWGKVYDRLGRPKEHAGYKLPEIEGFKADEARLDAFRQQAHKVGLSQGQFENMIAWTAESERNARAAMEQAHQQAHGKLAQGWGDEATANYEKARRVGEVLFNADQRKALGLGDDPKTWRAELVSALAGVAESFSEHRNYGRTEKDTGKTDDDLRAEHAALMAKPDYWTNAQHQARAQEIFEQLAGTRKVGPGAAAA